MWAEKATLEVKEQAASVCEIKTSRRHGDGGPGTHFLTRADPRWAGFFAGAFFVSRYYDKFLFRPVPLFLFFPFLKGMLRRSFEANKGGTQVLLFVIRQTFFTTTGARRVFSSEYLQTWCTVFLVVLRATEHTALFTQFHQRPSDQTPNNATHL